MDEPTTTANPSTEQLIVQRSVAQKILNRNLVNLADKVKAGKTLAASEVNLLKAAEGAPADHVGWARNQVELAEALGITRKSIQRWLRIPGNPGAKADGRYHVPEWRDWAKANGHRLDSDLDMTALRATNILLQNRRLEFQLGILTRAYVRTREVEQLGAELAVAIRKVVTGLHLCAPSVVGLTVAEADAFLKEKEDEILEQLHTLHTGLAELKTPTESEALDEETLAAD